MVTKQGGKFPLPSGCGTSAIASNLEEYKKITMRDLGWALKVLKNFMAARESLADLLKMLADAGVDVRGVNWEDPFSIMQAFMQAKGMGADVDIDTVVSVIEELEDVSFADIARAIDILETFMMLNERASKVAGRFAKRRVSSKEFDLLANMMGLNMGGAGGASALAPSAPVTRDVEDYEEDEEVDEELVNKMRSIVEEYKRKIQ